MSTIHTHASIRRLRERSRTCRAPTGRRDGRRPDAERGDECRGRLWRAARSHSTRSHCVTRSSLSTTGATTALSGGGASSGRRPAFHRLLPVRRGSPVRGAGCRIRARAGSTIVAMDGDRQNDPRDIPKLVENSTRLRTRCRDGWRSADRQDMERFSRRLSLDLRQLRDPAADLVP